MSLKSDYPLIVGASIESAGIGGVTIHIQRLLQWLDMDSIKYDLCDYKILSIREQLHKIRSHKIAHIHISRPFFRLVYIIYCRLVGTKSVFTVHGNIGRFSWLGNAMDQLSVRLCNIPILINAKSFEKAKSWNRNSIYLSIFLPPLEEGNLPDYVIKAIDEAKKSRKIIIACNASTMSFTDNGQEVYGITFVIEYFSKIQGYFLCISDPSGMYTKKYKNVINSNILFISEQHSFFKLMKMSDIMLRPTATDGDALSVREGLYLEKKVIATDVVDRPQGVILFKYNDSYSLNAALLSSSDNTSIAKENNVVSRIIEIYKSLINS